MMHKLAAASLALSAAFGAQAATLSYTFGLPVTQTTTEINQLLPLGLFDPSLGLLADALLEVFGSATFSFSGTNNAAQTQQASLTASTDLFWSSSLAALAPFLSDTIQLSATSGSQLYAVGQTRVFGPLSATGAPLTDNLGSILAALQGVGSFNLNCESLSGFTVVGGGGNISSSQSTIAGCGARITYTYTERTTTVPEPSSIALVGLALAAAGAATRRRKA